MTFCIFYSYFNCNWGILEGKTGAEESFDSNDNMHESRDVVAQAVIAPAAIVGQFI
jgi:hypothetical protein